MFFTNSQVGICCNKFYAQFLQIHRFTTLLSQPALLCWFPELMIWWGGNVPPRGRPSQSLRITEEPPQRALISSTVDDDFSTNILINSSYISLFDPISILCQEHILSCWNNDHKSFLSPGFNTLLHSQMCRHTQALHTYRINLSPFTKDFRVWGAPIETYLFIFGLPSGNFHKLTIYKTKNELIK